MAPVTVTLTLKWQGPGERFDFLDKIRKWNLKGVSDLPKVTLPVQVTA